MAYTDDSLRSRIDEIRKKHSSLAFPEDLPDARIDLFLVTNALLAKALDYATGIALLARFKATLAAGPLFRSLFEILIEFGQLLENGNPERNATKVIINALLEQLRAAERIEKVHGEENVAVEEKTQLEFRRRINPDIVMEVEEQRLKRQYHWSGESHFTIAERQTKTPIVYQFLSWDAHAAMAAVRAVKIKESGSSATLTFGGPEAAMFSDDQFVDNTGAMLTKIWNEHARLWGFELLPLEP